MSAPQPKPPKPQYSFTSFQVNNPTAPPPGDKLDSEHAQTAKVISDVIAWVGTSLNSDGSLKSAPKSDPTPIAGADGTALASNYATLAGAWAEHMPDTIPPNILAWADVTGDHWSSRWWANQAAQLVNQAEQIIDRVVQIVGGIDWAALPAPPPGAPIVVVGNITLPNNAAGSVNILGSGTPIMITLPSGPVLDQTLKFKDVAGNAASSPIDIKGGTNLIDGQADFYLYQNYQAAELFWTGSSWGVR